MGKVVSEDSKQRMKEGYWSKKKSELFVLHHKLMETIRKTKGVSKESKQKMSHSTKLYWQNLSSEEYMKICNDRKNKKRQPTNQETKDKIRKANLESYGKKKIECPVCGFIGKAISPMKRFHFSNCTNTKKVNRKIKNSDIGFWVQKGYTEYDARKLVCLLSTSKWELEKYFLPLSYISFFRTFNRKTLRGILMHIREKILVEGLTSLSGLSIYSKSRYSVNYWLFRGYSEEDAKKIISKIQKHNNIKRC